MDKHNTILDYERLKKQHLSVPEGYFDELPGRVMARIRQESVCPIPYQRRRVSQPWMAWVSAAAVVILVAWLGIRTINRVPAQDDLLADKMQFMIEFYGQDLNEAILAGYMEDQDIQLSTNVNQDAQDLIFYHPDQVESLLYESILEKNPKQ